MVQLFLVNVDDIVMFLAWDALFHFLSTWPKVTSTHYPNYHGSCARVISANTFMYFLRQSDIRRSN